MPRVDVWDVSPDKPSEKDPPLWVGFTRAKLEDRYDLGKQLGQGGFGSVKVVVERATGNEFACKSIKKRLNLPNVGSSKQQHHLENIRREALILRRLRGTLNVVHLEDVFEDEEAVHLVMEWCKGGELVQRINTRHYSERTAASYMRAVLRTLAQCHHLRILHRDIKPGNFMLLADADNAPVKAIDFGLAVFFDPKKLPRTDLGLEGTPHFMAPEQLSGKTEPASDIWSAGVMAYQLLCGFVPFDDARNPKAPALSLVWRSILTEEPKFTHRSWEGVSEEAKDFVRQLLTKDPKARPTAKQALAHPWLQGKSDQRTQGTPLSRTVVQRLQKFGVESALKRTVLDMIANELINRHMEALNHHQQQHHHQQSQTGSQQELKAPEDVANTHHPPNNTLASQTATTSPFAPPPLGPETTALGPDASEATPHGAAAAAATGTPLPPYNTLAAAADVTNHRRRQLAAQDLLLRSIPKHAATVHACGDALAALRRGQLLLGLPPTQTTTSVTGATPGAAGAVLPAGPASLAAIAAAAAAMQHQQPPHPSRRSHDLSSRPLTGTGAGLSRATTFHQQGSNATHTHPPPSQPPQLTPFSLVPPPSQPTPSEPSAATPPQPPQQQQQVQPAAVTNTMGIPIGRPPFRSALSAHMLNAAMLGPHAPGLGNMLLPAASPGRARPRAGAGGATGLGGILSGGDSSPGGMMTGPFAVAASPSAGGPSVLAGGSIAGGGGGGGVGSGGGSYKGPVKDLAAATAWDMNFMANRMAAEGSGHALQHYAWLLNMGERSLHGVLERSYHGGSRSNIHIGTEAAVPLSGGACAVHASGASGGAGGGGTSISGGLSGSGGSVSNLLAASGDGGASPKMRRSHTTAALTSVAPYGTSPGSAMGTSPGGGGDEYLRMLKLVAAQRAEHRKYQRLSLDTSVHRRTLYKDAVAAAAEAEAGGGDMGTAEEEAGMGMVPPQEADEDGGDGDGDGATTAGGGGDGDDGTITTTGAYSLPTPATTGPFGPSAATTTGAPSPGPSPGPTTSALSLLPPGAPLPSPTQGPPSAASPGTPFIGPIAAAAVTAAAGGGGGGGAVSRGVSGGLSGGSGGAMSGGSGSMMPYQKISIRGLQEADAEAEGSLFGNMGVRSRGTSLTGFVTTGGSGGGGGGMSRPSFAGSLLGAGESVDSGGGEGEEHSEGGGKKTSLLKKVRKALMKPVKTLLGAGSSQTPTSASAFFSISHQPTPKSVAATGGGGASTVAGNTAAVAATATAATAAAAAAAASRLGKTSLPPGVVSAGGGNGLGPGEARESGVRQSDTLACSSVASVFTQGEERGRGRGAYAAFLQAEVTGANTPNERSVHGAGSDRSTHSTAGGSGAVQTSPAIATSTAAAAVRGPAGYAIHTVKAHKEPPAAAVVAAAAAAVPPPPPASPALSATSTPILAVDAASGAATAAAAIAAAAAAAGAAGDGVVASPAVAAAAVAAVGGGSSLPSGVAAGGDQGGAVGGVTTEQQEQQQQPQRTGLRQEELAPALALLLGDPARVAELQDVMRRLQYDKAEELSYDQLSEGLQWLGYRLEPSEVQDLLRHVGQGAHEGLTASQFIASQVDWRSFQANHRAEWLDCLRHAFEELGGGAGGSGCIAVDQLVSALGEKLPEDEVNLAVQESLMDAAVDAEGVDFDAFVKMMRCNSSDSLASGASSEMSYDLYDPRIRDASLHGALGDGGHYQPALETVPDQE